MNRTVLTQAALSDAMARLTTWSKSECGKFIEKEFEFTDFKEAWAFMAQVAVKAEEMDHHPNWSNVYRMVHVSLSTHDADGVTELDIAMADFMDSVEQDPFSSKIAN